MNDSVLLAYQVLAGCSDATTGALLLMAPGFTLRMMLLRVPDDALVFISFIGAFVLATGIAYLYGAYLVLREDSGAKLQVLWLLTALTRASVAIFVIGQVLTGTLPVAWITVAAADGALVLFQATGLRKGWLARA
jgi:hypothetical protein